MRVALASMALKTGSSSPGEELMTFSTSEVAVSRWYASPSSRESRSTSISLPTAGRPWSVVSLRPRGSGRRIVPGQINTGNGATDVRFGSEADMCNAKRLRLLYPRKLTCAAQERMSAKGLRATKHHVIPAVRWDGAPHSERPQVLSHNSRPPKTGCNETLAAVLIRELQRFSLLRASPTSQAPLLAPRKEC